MPPQSFVSPVSVSHQPPVKPLGKWQASKMIVRQSWAVVKSDKAILWFPVLSMIVSIVVFVGMAAIVYFGLLSGDTTRLDTMANDETGGGVAYYIVLLVYYLVMFFIVNFFQAGVLSIADARFKGENKTFEDGLHIAAANAGRLFVWSLISATVGVILNVIADKFKLVGKIVAGVFGAAWSIMTYFSLPSLIIGKSTIKGSFTESAALIRKTWGEAIIVNFGMGLFFGVIGFCAFFVGLIIVILVPSVTIMIIVAIFFFLFVVILLIVSSSLSIIFKLALYDYARTGTVPAGFSPELIQGTVRGK